MSNYGWPEESNDEVIAGLIKARNTLEAECHREHDKNVGLTDRIRELEARDHCPCEDRKRARASESETACEHVPADSPDVSDKHCVRCGANLETVVKHEPRIRHQDTECICTCGGPWPCSASDRTSETPVEPKYVGCPGCDGDVPVAQVGDIAIHMDPHGGSMRCTASDRGVGK